jgi:thiamine pyrophosphate-dependent acetolactate synthase large subunit-like protein
MNNSCVDPNPKFNRKMPEISGAKIILDILGQKGIKHIFGVPGRESEAILFNEYQDINLILTSVENTAGFAAYSYAQITGKTQVVFTTIGPGIANMGNVIYSACSDRVPLIFITAQVERDRIFPNHTHQCIDAVAMYGNMTKQDLRSYAICRVPLSGRALVLELGRSSMLKEREMNKNEC